MSDIKVFCPYCKNYIMRTSEAFKVGGPYNGAMFKIPPDKLDAANYFPFEEWVTDGNLLCPMCDQQIETPEGNLLLEHGLVRLGQQSIDRGFSIIYPDNVLMYDSVFSKEIVEPEPEVPIVEEPEVEVMVEGVEEPPDVPHETPEEEVVQWKSYICGKCGQKMPHPWSHRKGCGD